MKTTQSLGNNGPTPDPGADPIFDALLRGLHPVDGPLNLALLRIAALERRVEYLDKRLAVLGRLVDLLAEPDGAADAP
jgi:hypothetical protein